MVSSGEIRYGVVIISLILCNVTFMNINKEFLRPLSDYYSSLYEQQEQQKGEENKENVSNCATNTHDNNKYKNVLPKTRQWENWPSTAYEEVGHPLVTKGESFFNNGRHHYFSQNNAALLQEFLQVYKARPDQINLCGIRINHAMALFLAVKKLQPSLVVESGVNAGVSTYFIRSASSTTQIYAIDPLDKPICNQGTRWIDTTSGNLTRYYTGKNFVDLLDLDWKQLINSKQVNPEKTLIFIDDHLHAFKRIAGVMKFGIRHVLVEDNYKIKEGSTWDDKKSTLKQMFNGHQWKKEGDWLFANIATYSEFPPLIPPILSQNFKGERKKAGGFMHYLDNNIDIVAPMLRPDLNEEDLKWYEYIANKLGFNKTKGLEDKHDYYQFMNYNHICYLELLPIPGTLLYKDRF